MTNILPGDPAGQASDERIPSLADADGAIHAPTPGQTRHILPRWRWQHPEVGFGLLPDDEEVFQRVLPWARRLFQLTTPLELAYAVLEPGAPYHIPKNMTIEAWFDPRTTPRSSQHNWMIDRVISRDDAIRLSPFPIPEQQNRQRKPDIYVTPRHLYRLRIQIEESPAWTVAWWEPAAAGSGGRVVEALYGTESCDNAAQAVATLQAAQGWLRGTNAVRRGPNNLDQEAYIRIWSAVRRRFPRTLRHGDKSRLMREVAENINRLNDDAIVPCTI